MRWFPNEPLVGRERAVALGVFDGIHIGHRAVISAACGVRQTADAVPFLTACVLSLTDVPKGGERLTADLPRLCDTLGVDEWLSLPFEAVRDMSPEQFVREILHERLHARVVCCGYNYRFGKGGVGTADTLIELCRRYGMEVRVIPSVEVEGVAVSSTRIRALLKAGDMPAVMRLLGRPFAISGTVSRGNRVGRTWGFPTINQVLEDGVALPRFGVYASLVTLGEKQHFAVTNVGIHPTVGTVARPQAETFIDDFEGDLYGQTVTVELIRHLRDERRFDNAEQLKAQIDRDKVAAFALLSGQAHTARAVLFDFDDTLQDRTAAFCGAIREMLTRHFPTLSEQEREARVHQMWLENNGGYEIRRWNAGAVSIDDSAKLNKLAKLIKTADFTIGSVNCPSPAFVTIEYSDDSCASFAVAVNSFNLFFRNGILFTTDEDIIDLFNLRETEFYQGFVGM